MIRSLSTKKATCYSRQRGGILMEAMIGLLIMGIVGGGMVHIAGRANVVQQEMALQEIAVRNMRDLLLRHGSGTLNLCANIPGFTLPDGTNLEVTVQGCDTVNASIRIGEIDVPVNDARQPLILSVETERLGLIRVGGNPGA